MKPTHLTPVLVLVLAGAVVGFLLELGLVASAVAVLVPPPTLGVTLIAIAVIVVALAVPISRAVRGTSHARVDPFRAMRVAVLAKASTLSGALLSGGTLGILLYLLSRRVIPVGNSVTLAVWSLIGAVVLLIGGLIAERLCTLPPDRPQTEENHD